MYVEMWVLILLVLLAVPTLFRFFSPLLLFTAVLAAVLAAIGAIAIVSVAVSGALTKVFDATAPWSGYAFGALFLGAFAVGIVRHLRSWHRGEVGLFAPLLEGKALEEYEARLRDNEAFEKSTPYRAARWIREKFRREPRGGPS